MLMLFFSDLQLYFYFYITYNHIFTDLQFKLTRQTHDPQAGCGPHYNYVRAVIINDQT